MPPRSVRSILQGRSTTLLVAACFSTLLAAQDDSTKRVMLKPTFGLGTGMFAFYGDIGSDHSNVQSAADPGRL